MGQPFRDRLKLAAAYAKVEYSQTAIARSLRIERKQTVDRWMADGMPTPPMIFHIADVWRVDPKWLATGKGDMAPRPAAIDGDAMTNEERALVAGYRSADPRWRLSLRLLAALANEDQIDAATDVNVIVARILRKKPSEVTYASDQRVAQTYGEAPHVAERKAKQRR